MADKLTFDVGLAKDLKDGFIRNGWVKAEQIKRLSEGDFLKRVLDVLEGRSEITPVTRSTVVDLDADPFVLEGWTVEEHRRGGSIDLATAKIDLYLSDGQKRGSVVGHGLRKALAGQPVLNANALDFYLANTHLIPEEWKTKAVFFWGTVYRDRGGDLFVRCLDWVGGRWIWNYYWLGDGWSASGPAAVVASR